LIVERRSSAPPPATVTRGRVYFDDVLKSYHGDTGTKIVEILTDTLAAHNILDTLHKDTTVATIVRGDLLVVDSVPKWVRLAKDSAASILQVDAAGNDLAWITPGTANQILSINPGAADLEYKTLTSTGDIDITPTSGDITIGFGRSFSGVSGTTVTTTTGGYEFSSLEIGAWLDFAPVRSINVVYQNTSGRKSRLAITIAAASTERLNVTLEVGVDNPPLLTAGRCLIEAGGAGNDQRCQLFLEVPDNWYYRVVPTSGTPIVDAWLEMDE